MNFAEVDRVIESGVDQGVFPGVTVLVSHGGTVRYRRAHGWRSLEPERTPLSRDMIYDTASLTKPLATTVALMLLVADHKLSLDDRVVRFFPAFVGQDKEDVTVRHLLSHASGLPAWRHYYQESARGEIYARALREPLEAQPGTRAVYSDVGFMLLGALVELLSGAPLHQYCAERIFQPLQLRDTVFLPLGQRPVTEERKLRFVPTENCPWRQRVLCAEVHDENAYAMGGVAGHAGLFSTVDDLNRLVSCLLACCRGTQAFLSEDVVREFWTRDGRVPASTWALGWDTPSPQHSSAGELFSVHSVGHLGFTGTSVWIDLERDVHVIVLSNRVHPRRDNTLIRSFRPALHNAVMRAMLGKC